MTNIPVVTLFSRSGSTARRLQDFLCSPALFNLKEIRFNDGFESEGDRLNKVFPTMSNLFRVEAIGFDSNISQCSRTGTIIHAISPKVSKESERTSSTTSRDLTELLCITSLDSKEASQKSAIRDSVASVLEKESLSRTFTSKDGIVLKMQYMFGRQISAQNLVGLDTDLPILSFPQLQGEQNYFNDNNFVSEDATKGTSPTKLEHSIRVDGLRELAIPYFEEGAITVRSKIKNASLRSPLHRRTGKPIIGLYEWPRYDESFQQSEGNRSTQTLIIRPLPAAQADMALSVPSLIFQCSFDSERDENEYKMEEVDSIVRNHGGCTSKVGFGGCGGTGQLLVHHPALRGLDIRLCFAPELSCSFNEAQESLLAASLEELQNSRVVAEGRQDSSSLKQGLEHTGNDCWVEFRANLKQPSGFMGPFGKSLGKTRRRPRVAKVPDIPYE